MFIWVPRHVGIEGNEEADKEARRAANSETEDVYFVKVSDFCNCISHKSTGDWQQLCNIKVTNSRKFTQM